MRLILLCSKIILSLSLFSQGDWTPLLNKNDINQWSSGPNCLIKSEMNGVTLSSRTNEEAWLTSPKAYGDFKLKGEFLIQEGGVAKLAFRVQEPQASIAEINGYAVLFDKNPEQQNSLGSIVQIARAKWLDQLNLNQWNHFEIIASGDHLQVKLDGQLVAEAHHRRSFYGYLKIGVTGSGIQWRNLQISEDLDQHKPLGPMAEDYLRSYPDVQYISIFDGKTLTGWHSTGTSQWRVTDGTIYGHSGTEAGFLVSEGAYRNFHLKFKFKILKEDNSGIFIRKPADSVAINLKNSVECNIYDHNGFTHAFSSGALATHARAWSAMVDYEDWNTGEIYALDDQVIMYINGQKASEAHLPDFNHTGNLCLQAGLRLMLEDKGPSEVYFKDLWIKCIDGK